jgi:hypothetical protein
MLLLHESREEHVWSVWSRWRESNPAIPVWRTGVSPQHFTCGGGGRVHLSSLERVRRTSRASARFVGGVGIEPTSRGLRNRCKGQHLLPTLKATENRKRTRKQSVPTENRASHPLESNQNLLGFSQARRPTTQEWGESAPAPRPIERSAGGRVRAPRRQTLAAAPLVGRPLRRPRRSSLRLSGSFATSPSERGHTKGVSASRSRNAAVPDPGFEPGLDGSEPSVVADWTSPVGRQCFGWSEAGGMAIAARRPDRGQISGRAPRNRTWRAVRASVLRTAPPP